MEALRYSRLGSLRYVPTPVHGSDARPRLEVEARRYCELLGAGGGYILGPARLFQPDVPPENILAVYRA